MIGKNSLKVPDIGNAPSMKRAPLMEKAPNIRADDMYDISHNPKIARKEKRRSF